ncbi:hypothetical protein HS088_TW10G00724 [Tripterygium wilfordii]|uniref:Small-subunit processome Utp12 domain-containing protein n=1 Tax=Tripterygium wilfordii TaxID=458696 RepID=A0A7J7D5U7_TRIWF|nr:WD repeat-containing protein 43 [Tripterygium wilfordii]KAF5741720.1 hypothetical protein HS088_TW10G00724 [Tripterygium wilfordii]
MESAAAATPKKKSNKKKRVASDTETGTKGDMINAYHEEVMDGDLVNEDFNEPTMGEKLATLSLQDKTQSHEKPHAQPPSADSVNVLLKQALHADDRALLLDCLYTQDDKVITNSISVLNPADVLKLLHSLVSIIQSRGAVLACALPWLRGLLLQHASGIMSQESSLVALNSLYQLIESRVSTFKSALQLSSCIDFLYAEVVDDSLEEHDAVKPVIYEDKDDSDEDESDEAMESDQDEKEVTYDEMLDGLSDVDDSDGMSD